jgi:hypothetical protein
MRHDCAETGKAPISSSTALDERLVISYLAPMATRLLLTLLALLTGLSAQLSPAQARVCPSVDTEIGEVTSATIAQHLGAGRVFAGPPSQRVARRDLAAIAFAPTAPAPVLPGVLQGIDRARE